MIKAIKVFIFCLLGSLIVPAFLLAQDKQEFSKLIIFHSLSCHRCQVVKTKIMPLIEKEFAGQVEFDYRELGDENNYKLLLNGMPNKRKNSNPSSRFLAVVAMQISSPKTFSTSSALISGNGRCSRKPIVRLPL